MRIRDTWIAGYDGLFWDCLQARIFFLIGEPPKARGVSKISDVVLGAMFAILFC